MFDVKCVLLFFFFFQAEDGIRDRDVTGVQTCALPISRSTGDDHARRHHLEEAEPASGAASSRWWRRAWSSPVERAGTSATRRFPPDEIGRASCRERREVLVGAEA